METPLFDRNLEEKIATAGVVAVLVVDDSQDAVPLARALLQGGVVAMELTLRTPAAIEALKAIRRDAPEMTVGIGTILSVDQLHAACEAGAAFGVAPGCNPRLLAAARRQGLPFAPGIATPSDIETAVDQGCRLLKLFPAEHLGGLPYLQAIAAPYIHLGLRYIPLGGLTAENAVVYAKSPLVAAIGGSWIASREAIRAKDWGGITARARAAMEMVSAKRPQSSP